MSTKAEIQAINKYNKEKTKCIMVRLNKTTDADIIAKIDSVPSKMGYIKNLIRKDMLQSKLNDAVEAFLRGKIKVVLPDVGYATDFLQSVQQVNPDIKWFDGHDVTDWYPYGCFDHFYMWVEQKDGASILKADGFYEVEKEDFIGDNVFWWIINWSAQ